MSQKRICQNCKKRIEKKCTEKNSKFNGKWMARKSAACEDFQTK